MNVQNFIQKQIWAEVKEQVINQIGWNKMKRNKVSFDFVLWYFWNDNNQ